MSYHACGACAFCSREMPLVNSPRVGVCGYVGPVEPPY